MPAGSHKPKPSRIKQPPLFFFPFQIPQVESMTSSHQRIGSKPDKQRVSAPFHTGGFPAP